MLHLALAINEIEPCRTWFKKYYWIVEDKYLPYHRDVWLLVNIMKADIYINTFTDFYLVNIVGKFLLPIMIFDIIKLAKFDVNLTSDLTLALVVPTVGCLMLYRYV